MIITAISLQWAYTFVFEGYFPAISLISAHKLLVVLHPRPIPVGGLATRDYKNQT
jgi:hypothetical protein